MCMKKKSTMPCRDSLLSVPISRLGATKRVDRHLPDSLLDGLDLPSLEELDPSTAGGWRLVCDREVPCELRSAAPAGGASADVGDLEAVRVRVFVLGSAELPEAVKLELSSEANLFFYWHHQVTPEHFAALQQQQGLMIAYSDYPAMLAQMLAACVREPHSHFAYLVMQQEAGEACLSFVQNMSFKFVELLSCKCQVTSEEVVRAQISHRYTAMKSRLALLQARLADISSLVKLKNPSLLMQLQTVPPRLLGCGSGAQQATARDPANAGIPAGLMQTQRSSSAQGWLQGVTLHPGQTLQGPERLHGSNFATTFARRAFKP